MCTRILSNEHEKPIVVAPTMDWQESTQPKLYVFPKDRERNGGKKVGDLQLITDNYNTQYRTAIDLTNKRFFFELTTEPNVIWMDIKKFNLEANASVMALDPYNMELSGDVTEKFEETSDIYCTI
jgi:penicillin V acylase-like amidase (Ntn superfamily)